MKRVLACRLGWPVRRSLAQVSSPGPNFSTSGLATASPLGLCRRGVADAASKYGCGFRAKFSKFREFALVGRIVRLDVSDIDHNGTPNSAVFSFAPSRACPHAMKLDARNALSSLDTIM